MRACRLASWGGDVTGWVLPEVGAGALAQRATVLQPGHVGQWLPVSPAVQPRLLPLQDAVLPRGARAADPGGHCGRGGVVRPGGSGWGRHGGGTRGAQGADVPSTATTKSLRASPWAFLVTHV